MKPITRALMSVRATQYLQSKGYLMDRTVPAKLDSILGAFCAIDGTAYKIARHRLSKFEKRDKWALLGELIAEHRVQLTEFSPRGGAPVTLGEDLEHFSARKIAERIAAKNRAREYDEYRAFYDGAPWRKLRYEALRMYGRRCQLCGRSPDDGITLHVDHIKPRSKFRELELDIRNLQVLCEDCNMGKSNIDSTDWRPKLVVSSDKR